jgi:ABC-type lipoprotein release transport system permease subunit
MNILLCGDFTNSPELYEIGNSLSLYLKSVINGSIKFEQNILTRNVKLFLPLSKFTREELWEIASLFKGYCIFGCYYNDRMIFEKGDPIITYPNMFIVEIDNIRELRVFAKDYNSLHSSVENWKSYNKKDNVKAIVWTEKNPMIHFELK